MEYARKQKFSPGQRAYPEVTLHRCQSITPLPTTHGSTGNKLHKVAVVYCERRKKDSDERQADERPDERTDFDP